MGRYRRWLHHQEIDRQLHTYLHALEAELARLEEQATTHGASKHTISRENSLLLALTASMNANMLPVIPLDRQSQSFFPTDSAFVPDTPQEELASALPHDELALQPEDMKPDFDAQSPTEPQLELPHWLHALIETSLHNNQGTHLMNTESLRSNRLFQRWSERWGQVSHVTTTTGETMKQELPRKEQES